MKKLRTFFGLSLGPEIHDIFLNVKKWVNAQNPKQNIRFTSKENLHITLRFLGETPEDICKGLIEQVAKEMQNFKELTLPIASLNYFPPNKKRIIALSLSLTQTLADLLIKLNPIIDQFGFIPEQRPFVPHITLARKTEHSHLDFSTLPFTLPKQITCPNLVFFESKPQDHGSLYVPLKVFSAD